MTTSWIARSLEAPSGVDLVMIPGLCEGDTGVLAEKLGVDVEKGPKDLRDIPRHFGRSANAREYGAWDIEIVAEINNAPRLTREAIRREAARYRASGADIIDIGCTPGLPFPALADVVTELVDAGMRVSVDSLDPGEIATAVEAGAELVMSVNGSNIEVAQALADRGARFVVIPDMGGGMDSLEPTVARLQAWGVPFLIDPILEPIGMGFMASLERYAEGQATMAGGGDVDGHRESDGADGSGFDGCECAADRRVSGTGHPQCADDGSDSMGPWRRTRGGCRQTADALRSDEAHRAEGSSTIVSSP
jgi:hypothetical protein